MKNKLSILCLVLCTCCMLQAETNENTPVPTALAEGKVSTGNKQEKKAKIELAVCAMFYNEADYLKEWIEFHQIVGVEKFYLYNHNSTDHFLRVLRPYINKGIVVLKHWHFVFKDQELQYFDHMQREAYNDAIKKNKTRVKWIAFLDIDEYLFPVEKNTIQEVLADYEEFGGVAVNWQMFGTSHVDHLPLGKTLIETLVLQSPQDFWWNKRIKSIIQPRYTRRAQDPHYFYHGPDHLTVNTDKVPFYDGCSPYIVVDKLRINHYYTRTEEHFFKEKVPRRKKWRSDYSWDEWFDALNTEYNDQILRFLPELKRRLKKSGKE